MRVAQSTTRSCRAATADGRRGGGGGCESEGSDDLSFQRASPSKKSTGELSAREWPGRRGTAGSKGGNKAEGRTAWDLEPPTTACPACVASQFISTHVTLSKPFSPGALPALLQHPYDNYYCYYCYCYYSSFHYYLLNLPSSFSFLTILLPLRTSITDPTPSTEHRACQRASG